MSKPCSGCGNSIEQCIEWKKKLLLIACCPDCEHEEMEIEKEYLEGIRAYHKSKEAKR